MRRRTGTTLVEVLAVVGVVALLMALLLPAIRSARLAAQATACMACMSGPVQGQIGYSQQSSDCWLNPLPPGAIGAMGEMGETGALVYDALDIVNEWPYFLKQYIFEKGESAAGITCPTLYPLSTEEYEINPGYGASVSYYYSAAFVTEWSMWSPQAADQRESPDSHREVVRCSSVSHPSAKVLIPERVSRHRGPAASASEASASADWRVVGFVDGHAGLVDANAAMPALSVAWPVSEQQWSETALPNPLVFSCAPFGYRGHDF